MPKKKYYLANVLSQLDKKNRSTFKEGLTIYFDMPPFYSGDYEAKIYKDELGLYINSDDNYFNGCRDYSISK